MPHPSVWILALSCLAAEPARAAPQNYVLDAGGTEVGFTWFFGPDAVSGTMPIRSAQITLDFDNLPASHVDVMLDVAHANAGFPFADQAMRGPQMLDARSYPQISFVSRRIMPSDKGATIEGDMTIRGVTRPATLAAELYRQSGTEPEDRSRLVILLTGRLDRRDFGADGWPDMVGPEVRLRILARISAGG